MSRRRRGSALSSAGVLLCVVRRGAEEAFNDQRGANVRVDEERFVDLVHDSQQGRRAVHFDFLQRRYDNPQRKRKVRRHEVKHEDRLEIKTSGQGAGTQWIQYRARLLVNKADAVLVLDQPSGQDLLAAIAAVPGAPAATLQIKLRSSGGESEAQDMSVLEVGKVDPGSQFIVNLPADAATGARDSQTFRVSASPQRLLAWKEIIRAECCDGTLPQWKDGASELNPDQLPGKMVEVNFAADDIAGQNWRRGQILEFSKGRMWNSSSKSYKIDFIDGAQEEVKLRHRGNSEKDTGKRQFRMACNPTSVDLHHEQISTVGGGSSEISFRWDIQQEQFKYQPHIWQVGIRDATSKTWPDVPLSLKGPPSGAQESMFVLDSQYHPAALSMPLLSDPCNFRID
eukprot:COSAG01_NODE_3148_length_6514_cov_194.153079_6_plen_398_part_00